MLLNNIKTLSVAELQQLQGSIINCKNNSDYATYWLVSAITDIQLNTNFVHSVTCAIKACATEEQKQSIIKQLQN